MTESSRRSSVGRQRRPKCMMMMALLLVLLLSILQSSCHAKVVSGDFVLSGVDTEKVLSTFAVMPQGGRVDIRLKTKEQYNPRNPLNFRLYRDTEWPKYLNALTCVDKKRHALLTKRVEWERSEEHESYHADLQTFILNDEDGSSKRNHYWYFVVDDCSLEQVMQDGDIPAIHFKLTVKNELKSGAFTHLSADEENLSMLHAVTMSLSGFVGFMLLMKIMIDLSSKHKSIHAALLWVCASAFLDASSSLCELLHLKLYEYDGVGSYALDAASAHLEACCDASLVLLLLGIAAGWTLPSDVIAVNANATQLQKLVQGLSSPIHSLFRCNAAGILGGSVIGFYVVLAQWGRTYDEEFESYHDYEHLPGKILMGLRIVLGVLCVAGAMQTKLRCNAQQLHAFYVRVAIIGFAWFESLPFMTWLCTIFIPYYLRHPAVCIMSALLQSSSIMGFAWLVTSQSTAYHKYSHMAAPSEESLPEATSPRNGLPGGSGKDNNAPIKSAWKLGKSKVRLD